MSIANWFDTFNSNLLMKTTTVGDISYRYKRITKQLNKDFWNSDSDTLHSLYVGSYGRGTEIHTSDIDVVMQLPSSVYTQYNNHQGNGQSALLQAVKTSIERTYKPTYMKADGQFEISVSCTDNSKTRSVINTYLTLPFSPNQLFTFTHDVITRHRWAGLSPRRYWRPRINGFVAVDMLQASSISARFMFNNWSLFQYSNTWSYEWKEVDNTVAQSNDSFAERKYNTNIEGSVNGGNETKFGLKWGSSLQQTASTTRTNRWTVGSDIFSQHDVNFYDKILNKNPCNNFLYPRIYDAGNVQFEIRPIQVEF